MKSMTKQLAFVALVGGTLVGWGARTDRDIVVAQRRTPIMVTRMFTGPDGQTHAEDVELKLNARGDSELSEIAKVTGLQFRRQAPNYFQDWHPAPRRQYVITLSGQGEVEFTGGKKVRFGPGHIMLAEDLTGKGHISRGVGTEDRVSLFLPLAE